jgi:hypothetical protein
VPLLLLIFFIAGKPSFAQSKGTLTKAYVDSLKKNEEKLWYVDKFKSTKKPVVQKKTETINWGNWSGFFDAVAAVFQVLVWVVISLAIAGAAYLILKNLKGFKFRSNPDIPVTTADVITEEVDIQTLNTLDLGSQIEKCIQEKNYRLAVRYYYLWAMKVLSEAQLIEFNIDKTNQDYTRELSRKNTFSRERLSLFIQCTHYYEYLWFGNFLVSEPAFLSIEKTFKDFLTKKA